MYTLGSTSDIVLEIIMTKPYNWSMQRCTKNNFSGYVNNFSVRYLVFKCCFNTDCLVRKKFPWNNS